MLLLMRKIDKNCLHHYKKCYCSYENAIIISAINNGVLSIIYVFVSQNILIGV